MCVPQRRLCVRARVLGRKGRRGAPRHTICVSHPSVPASQCPSVTSARLSLSSTTTPVPSGICLHLLISHQRAHTLTLTLTHKRIDPIHIPITPTALSHSPPTPPSRLPHPDTRLTSISEHIIDKARPYTPPPTTDKPSVSAFLSIAPPLASTFPPRIEQRPTSSDDICSQHLHRSRPRPTQRLSFFHLDSTPVTPPSLRPPQHTMH